MSRFFVLTDGRLIGARGRVHNAPRLSACRCQTLPGIILRSRWPCCKSQPRLHARNAVLYRLRDDPVAVVAGDLANRLVGPAFGQAALHERRLAP